MRLAWLTCAIVAGAILRAEAESSTLEIDVGKDFPLNLATVTIGAVSKCHLEPPSGDTIQLIPENQSDERIKLQTPNAMMGCAVIVHSAKETDDGLWKIVAENTDGVSISREYQVTVLREGVEWDDSFFDDKNVKKLPEIEHLARSGMEVSITLSNQGNSEECFLITPLGEKVALDVEEPKVGIKSYGSSEIVSCRAVVGPLDGNMIGTWYLCGRYTENAEELVRCQPANINWYNNSPNSNWNPTIRNTLDYVVNYGMMLTPNLRHGSSTNRNCHVITPRGEDIVLTSESDYPGLQLVRLGDTSCVVAIGPIAATMLGDWTIYGTFISFFSVMEELHQPLHLYLYDENDPYRQAYNVTVLDKDVRVINTGIHIDLQVPSSSGFGDVDECYVVTPQGNVYDYGNASAASGVEFRDYEQTVACRAVVGPVEQTMLGEWMLVGKFSRDRRDGATLFTERRLPIYLEQEDPANPKEENITRTVENLPEQYFDTEVSAHHVLTIQGSSNSFITDQSCHIRTPDNLQYRIMDGFYQPGVEVITGSNIACGIKFTVTSESNVGKWMLLARDQYLSTPRERRLQFTIYIEEQVEAVQNAVTIAEGNDLHIRLRNPTDLHTSCKLAKPDGTYATADEYELNDEFIKFCGFIVRDVRTTDTGTWTIVYGTKTTYKAPVDVTVVGRWEAEMIHLNWIKDRPVEVTVGPEDAVYCKITDPGRRVVVDGFGVCRISLNKVALRHNGIWTMIVGSPGRVLTEEHKFSVTVNEAAPKALVTTHVEKERPTVVMTCSVEVDDEVRSCKFRDPKGKVLLASHGVGEDRYTFHGVGVTVQSNVTTHECGLRITNPLLEELGIWRCAVETNTDTYYGFLPVLCPWVMSQPELAENIVSEPVLSVDQYFNPSLEGESVTLSCSVQSAIRYCYFRAQNGTVYNVGPGTTSDSFEYVGAGFDAGECGIRFSSLQVNDSGNWGCFVGFPDDSKPEQRDVMTVIVSETISVRQRLLRGNVIIEVNVHDRRALDYCRFVRIDGLGFTSENMPPAYNSRTDLEKGECNLSIENANILEMHPWTVAVKIRGQDVELSKTTVGSFPEEVPVPTPVPVRTSRFAVLWVVIMMLCLSIFFFGVLLGPKKNRDWTYARASTVSTRIRSSFRRNNTTTCQEKTTAMAA